MAWRRPWLSWLVYWRIYTSLGLNGLNGPRESTRNNSYKEHPDAKDRWSCKCTKNDIMTTANQHDDVIKWKHFPRYSSFDVFFDLCLNKRLSNNCKAGDLRRHCAHYDVFVMKHSKDTGKKHGHIVWDILSQPIGWFKKHALLYHPGDNLKNRGPSC